MPPRQHHGGSLEPPSGGAAHRRLLDLAVASPDDYSWESLRPELQQLYTEAKQVDVARQVGPIA